MKRPVTLFFALIFSAFLALTPDMARAETYTLNLQNHAFDLNFIEVPAGKKITLHIFNRDDTPEVFEVPALGVAKELPAQNHFKVYLPALKAGHYEYFGKYNDGTAKGLILAVQ